MNYKFNPKKFKEFLKDVLFVLFVLFATYVAITRSIELWNAPPTEPPPEVQHALYCEKTQYRGEGCPFEGLPLSESEDDQ
jgi:hypothetical protein